MAQPQLAIKIIANTQELIANLNAGRGAIEAYGPTIAKMQETWSRNSAQVVEKAALVTAAMKNIDAASLSAADAAKNLKVLEAGLTQMKQAGQEIPPLMQKTAAELRAVADATKQAEDKSVGFFAGLTAGVTTGNVLTTVLEKIGGAALSVVGAFPGMIERSIQLGNQLYEMSLKTGASVEGLSALRYAASQTGVDFTSFSTVLGMMEKNLGAVGPAATLVQGRVSQLGLDLLTLKNERPDQAFIDIAAALYAIPNNADRAAIAAQLLGRGAKEMAALWHENLGEMLADAQRLGLVMSTETAAAAHAAEIGFQSLGMQLEAVGMRISAAFLPAIIGVEQNLSESFTVAVGDVNKGLDDMGKGNGFLATVARAMGTGNGAIAAQVTLYETLRDTIVTVVRGGIEPLVTAGGFLMTEWDAAQVVAALVAQGFRGITYTVEEIALAFLKLQNVMPGTFGAFSEDIKTTQTALGYLYDDMVKGQVKIEGLKKSEQDWSDGSTKAVAAIEAALVKFGMSHTDVAAIIAKFAKNSRDAYGGVSDGVAGATKTLNAMSAEDARVARLAKQASDERAAALRFEATAWKAWENTVSKAIQRIVGDLKSINLSSIAPLIDASGTGSIVGKPDDLEKFKKQAAAIREEAKKAAEEWTRNLGLMEQAFKELASVVGGDAGKIIGSLGGVVDALKTSSSIKMKYGDPGKGGILTPFFDADAEAADKWAAAITAAVTIVSGAMSVWKAASEAGTKATATFNAAMAGAQAGAAFGPWGVAIGAAAGAVTGFIRSLTAGRREVEAFAQSMGGFDALHDQLLKSLDGIGEEFWVKLTQQIAKGDKAGADKVIAEIQAALANAPDALAAAAGYKTTAELQAVADKAKQVYDYMVKSGQYAASEIANAFAKMAAAQAEAMGGMAGQASAAGYKTMAQLKVLADQAEQLYEYMRDSGLYSAEAVADAWQKAIDAAVAAGDTQAIATKKAKDAIAGLDGQIKSLQDSIANEAPEEVMGIVEAQARAQIDALKKQRDEAAKTMETLNQNTTKGLEDVATALNNLPDEIKIRVQLQYAEPGGWSGGMPPGKPAPSVPAPGGGSSPNSAWAGSSAANAPGNGAAAFPQIVINMDGMKVGESFTRTAQQIGLTTG